MKKFSKKVKSILAIAIALVCVLAIAITAIVVGKKDKKPSVELNKEAQQFLSSQKSFADAISSRDENSQNVFYVESSKFSSLIETDFSHLNGKVLVMTSDLPGGAKWETPYYLSANGAEKLEFSIDSTGLDKQGSNVYFQNGKVIVQESYKNMANDDEYSIWYVLNIKEDGTVEKLIQKRVEKTSSVVDYFAGNTYFGYSYTQSTTAKVEIIPFNTNVQAKTFEVDSEYSYPQVAFAENSCLFELDSKP